MAAPRKELCCGLNVVSGFYRDVVKELRRLGFGHHRNAKGSHEIWMNEKGIKIIVPRNLAKRHTANGILKDAGSSLRL